MTPNSCTYYSNYILYNYIVVIIVRIIYIYILYKINLNDFSWFYLAVLMMVIKKHGNQ